MLLCDIGNTSYHFLDSKHDYKKSVATFNPQTIKEKIYYISVNPKITKILQEYENWIDLSKFVEMNNYYDTMGVDRIFACEAVKNAVIVDSGSAITVDVVRDGIFEGGFIYPGTRAMSETYKNISSALNYPFNYEVDLNKLPKNSIDSISYGYLKTLQGEVLSHSLDIILTGGDADKLFNIFPSAKIDKNLIFSGMKKILKEIE